MYDNGVLALLNIGATFAQSSENQKRGLPAYVLSWQP
jgi:hypothetical protein